MCVVGLEHELRDGSRKGASENSDIVRSWEVGIQIVAGWRTMQQANVVFA